MGPRSSCPRSPSCAKSVLGVTARSVVHNAGESADRVGHVCVLKYMLSEQQPGGLLLQMHKRTGST